MTTVRLKYARPTASGYNAPATATVEVVPTSRYTVEGAPDTVVIPTPFTIDTTNGGTADVNLAPTGAGWAWTVTTTIPGISAFTETVLVPNDVEGIDYADLVRVDPDTLETVQPTTAWWAEIEALKKQGGIKGDEGPQGLPGRDGAAGARGERGEKGDTGDTGIGSLSFLAPNPEGVDDTAALQAVIDQAAESAFTRRVLGRTGVYAVTRIFIPTGVTLADIRVIQKAGSNYSAIQLSGAGARADNVEVDGNAANQTNDTVGIELSATRCVVTRSYVHDTKSRGIAVTGTYAHVTHNDVRATGGASIDVVGGSYSIVEGNSIDGSGSCGVGVSGNAIHVSVIGNNIRNTGVADGVTAYGATIRNLIVVGNNIENSGNHGVHVGGNDILVAHNNIQNVTSSGVFYRNQDSSVGNNIAFNSNTVSGAPMSGVRVELATNVTVTGNSVNGCLDGLFIDYGTSVTATGNTIKNATANGARISNSQNVSLNGNVLESSALDGVYILTCTGVTALGNIIAGTAAGRGFRLYRTERATITGNTLRNIFTEAIYGFDTASPTTPCRYITITGNTIHTAGGGIKSVENSDYWTVGVNTYAGITGPDLTLTGANNKTFSTATTPANLQYAPTGALATTMDRRTVAGSSIPVVASGTMRMTAIWLAKGTVVTSVTYLAGATAAGLTNRWFALFDLAKNLLRTTSDNTATWAAGATLTLPLASTYTVPADGLYYIGICEVATTTTALRGIGASSNSIGISPPLNGDGPTGLTNAASTPAAGPALTVSGNMPYAYVS